MALRTFQLNNCSKRDTLITIFYNWLFKLVYKEFKGQVAWISSKSHTLFIIFSLDNATCRLVVYSSPQPHNTLVLCHPLGIPKRRFVVLQGVIHLVGQNVDHNSQGVIDSF